MGNRLYFNKIERDSRSKKPTLALSAPAFLHLNNLLDSQIESLARDGTRCDEAQKSKKRQLPLDLIFRIYYKSGIKFHFVELGKFQFPRGMGLQFFVIYRFLGPKIAGI